MGEEINSEKSCSEHLKESFPKITDGELKTAEELYENGLEDFEKLNEFTKYVEELETKYRK